jgi:hypothetical protein
LVEEVALASVWPLVEEVALATVSKPGEVYGDVGDAAASGAGFRDRR